MHLSAALEPADPLETGTADPGVERSRRGPARRTLRLTALTSTPSVGSAQVVVHDISTAGILIEGACGMLSKDDRLTISLPEKDEVDARVVWQSGRFSGCQFADPVSVSVVSAALLKGEAVRKGAEKAPNGATRSLSVPRRFEPELNFGMATALSLLLWLAIGAAALAFAW